MRYQRAIWNSTFVSYNCGMTRPNIWPIEIITFSIEGLLKIDKSPGEEIFGVCKKTIEKLIDYFFMILDLGTVSFGNGYLFTELKENSPLIKKFRSMYIDFD